jgi:hypothetical protein
MARMAGAPRTLPVPASCLVFQHSRTNPTMLRSCRRAAGVPAPMPMLRRPHDHHRDLRARLNAAHPSIEPDQDRHIMTPFTRRRRPECFSDVPPPLTGTRALALLPDQRAAGQASQPCSRPPDAPPRLLIRMRQRLAPSGLDRRCRPAHIGQHHFPHSARHHRANLSRGLLPCRFPDAGPATCRAVVMAPASENLHGKRRSTGLFAALQCLVRGSVRRPREGIPCRQGRMIDDGPTSPT